MSDCMQTCNMDERTNEEKLRDQITTLQRQLAEANNAKRHVIQQAEIQALEARAQRAIVMSIGELVGCKNDWEMCEAVEKYIAAQRGEIEKLRSGINDVIGYNVQEAIDRYGDASKAESWACVRRLRAALTKGGE